MTPRQTIQNTETNEIHILLDLVVPEPQRHKTLTAKIRIASDIRSAFRMLKPAIAAYTSEVVAFKRDYEERAKELAEEIAEDAIATEAEQAATALFSEKAAADAASAKTEAKKVENERRMRSIAQGYTGNMCSECQISRWCGMVRVRSAILVALRAVAAKALVN